MQSDLCGALAVDERLLALLLRALAVGRVGPEAARREVAQSVKACVSDGGLKADCIQTAKEQFESFGGIN